VIDTRSPSVSLAARWRRVARSSTAAHMHAHSPLLFRLSSPPCLRSARRAIDRVDPFTVVAACNGRNREFDGVSAVEGINSKTARDLIVLINTYVLVLRSARLLFAWSHNVTLKFDGARSRRVSAFRCELTELTRSIGRRSCQLCDAHRRDQSVECATMTMRRATIVDSSHCGLRHPISISAHQPLLDRP
jgi:hypothetical protein